MAWLFWASFEFRLAPTPFQKCRHLCQHTPWSSARLLCSPAGEGDAADDGASDTRTQDRHDHPNDVEERSGFRATKLVPASSLSISGEEGFPSLGFSPVVVGRVLEMLGSRGVSVNEIGPACFGTESPITRYALSDNQK